MSDGPDLAPRLASTRLVYVADREADMLPLMTRSQQLGCPADWLIHAAHNRCLPNSEKLWPHATDGMALGEIEFLLAARPGGKARLVRQQSWARRVELKAGKATPSKRPASWQANMVHLPAPRHRIAVVDESSGRDCGRSG